MSLVNFIYFQIKFKRIVKHCFCYVSIRHKGGEKDDKR